MEVFLGTRGFVVLAEAVVLMAFASHAATVSSPTMPWTFSMPWLPLGPFAVAAMLLYCVPFLLGGTNKTAPFRVIAEIEQWVKITSGTSDTISATGAIFKDSITSSMEGTDHNTLIRLPIS